jgi:hypothetical protein
MSETTSIPLVMTLAGPIPATPSALQQAIINNVQIAAPGYTVLPGGLCADVSGTEVAGLTIADQARVDAVNAVTPFGANATVLAALGLQFGIPQGIGANANVYLIFSGSIGYFIPPGFTVSDGAYQYVVQDGGSIESGGSTQQLYAVASASGIWAIPAATVTQIVTSVPIAYTVTVTNPNAGTPGSAGQPIGSYRAQVMTAGQVASTGTPSFLKTLLYGIIGVQQNLVSVRALSGGWQVICGGGDAYAVAGAILQAVPDISAIKGSQLAITAITAANPAVITTNLNHNYAVGATIVITGATPSGYNTTYTVASVTALTITTNINSSAFGAYTSGALLTPNPRNITASVFQNPDTYSIVRVNPPQQIVTVAATWNTTLPGFTAAASVAQLAAPALITHINSIYVGQPINLLEMTAAFQAAVVSILATVNLTTLTFVVTINGVTTSPTAGTSIIVGDPESYFYVAATGLTVTQG